MTKLLRFNGRQRLGPNDSMTTGPIPGIWYAGEKPRHISQYIELRREMVIDRATAQRFGRICGEHCEGDCFALLHAATWNLGPDRNQIPPVFEVLDIPPTDAPASPQPPKRNTPRSRS